MDTTTIATGLAVAGFFAIAAAVLIFAHLRQSLALYTSGLFFACAGSLRLWVWLAGGSPNARLLVFAFFALGVTCLLIRLFGQFRNFKR